MWFFDFLANLHWCQLQKMCMTLSGNPPIFPLNVAATSLKPPFTPVALAYDPLHVPRLVSSTFLGINTFLLEKTKRL